MAEERTLPIRYRNLPLSSSVRHPRRNCSVVLQYWKRLNVFSISRVQRNALGVNWSNWCLFLASCQKIQKSLFFLNRRLVESRVSCVWVCVLELEKRPSLSPEDLPIECMVSVGSPSDWYEEDLGFWRVLGLRTRHTPFRSTTTTKQSSLTTDTPETSIYEYNIHILLHPTSNTKMRLRVVMHRELTDSSILPPPPPKPPSPTTLHWVQVSCGTMIKSGLKLYGLSFRSWLLLVLWSVSRPWRWSC